MESKFYYFPGQTSQNTKISDRAHALHITKTAWGNITQHLDRKKRIQENIDKERRHREALKKGSEEMTKEWANSIENLRLKAEEERRTHLERKNAEKILNFYKLRDEQKAVREQYVEKVKKQIFRSEGPSRKLNTALVLSETLYEREAQKEFNEKIRQHQLEMKKKQDEEILAADARHKLEDAQKKKELLEKEKQVGKILEEQIKQREDSLKAETQAAIERDTLERINAEKEMELLKRFEKEEKIRKRREMAEDKKQEREEERKRQQIAAKENEEMEQAVAFYRKAKDKIDCLMKTKEKQMREEAIKQREEVTMKVAAIYSADTGEEERFAKMMAEIEEQEREKSEAKKAFNEKAIKDRIEDRRQYLERLEAEKKAENEMKRWELLNRYKTKEALAEYDEQAKREKWAKILQYRRDLLEQMHDDVERMKHEKEIDDLLSHVSYTEIDKKFFEYANEVLELAKKKNRPTYPIEKVIYEYKKLNSLLPKTRHCIHCCKK